MFGEWHKCYKDVFVDSLYIVHNLSLPPLSLSLSLSLSLRTELYCKSDILVTLKSEENLREVGVFMP